MLGVDSPLSHNGRRNAVLSSEKFGYGRCEISCSSVVGLEIEIPVGPAGLVGCVREEK